MPNAAIRPKPKPTRLMKGKRKTVKKITSMCADCGSWWRGGKEFEIHDPECTRELPVIVKNARKTERQMICEALDYVFRELTKWRDGIRCVIHGDMCGTRSEWGHVIPQGSCSYLVYEPSNSFRQSDTCNQIHRFVQAPYYDWYKAKFGQTAYKMLIEAWKNAPKGGNSTQELIEMLPKYVELYKNRFAMNGATLEQLVEAGFYGEIIQDAWKYDGRI